MKFREHRGGLAESMATVVEVADRAALVAHVKGLLTPFAFGGDIGAGLDVRPYDPLRLDERIGWYTHIVTLEGYGVLGFTDGPLKE